MESIGTPIMWSVFIALVIAALLIDLVVLKQSGPHKVTMREAGLWSICWIGLALLFNFSLWWYLKGSMGEVEANRIGLEFLTGYLVEKALAVDNFYRCSIDRAIPLDPVFLRRVSGVDRCQDALGRRTAIRPERQSDPEMVAWPPAGDRQAS